MSTGMNGKVKGFTLAEVLITLGIIGVVAALTIPVLINYIGNRYITQARVSYINLVKIMRAVEAEVGPYDAWPLLANNNFYIEHFDKRLQFIEKSMRGEPTFVNYFSSRGTNTTYSYHLRDGTFLSFMDWGSGMTRILIDVNGNKDPNVFGVDIYELSIITDKSKVTTGRPMGFSAYGAGLSTEDNKLTCSRKPYNDNITVSCLQILIETNFDMKSYPIKNWGN